MRGDFWFRLAFAARIVALLVLIGGILVFTGLYWSNIDMTENRFFITYAPGMIPYLLVAGVLYLFSHWAENRGDRP